MPEATEDAVFLIATSYQALGRAKAGDEETMTCNCTVVLVFAAFFIEANLSHIIREMGDLQKMKSFLNAKNPGFYPKLTWFYNEYVRRRKTEDREALFSNKFRKELYDYFEGLEEIHSFRNNVAHGKLDLPCPL
jgi:hypothetical protein